VQRGPNGAFVYVVGSDDKAALHLVQVEKQDEHQAVIASGVEPPARVVTTGFVQLTDGKRVKIGSGQGVEVDNPARGRKEPRPQGAKPGTSRAPTVGAGTAAAAERSGHRGGRERRHPTQ